MIATIRPDDSTLQHTANERGASIVLESVTKTYGSATVVDDIDLTIEAGEFISLLGPSGSGKTTTLNMIAGFTEATSGRLSMYGRPLNNVPPHRRELGVVFQSYALFPHRTVAENVRFPLERKRIPKAQIPELVSAALEMVRMTPYADRYPGELSGGQQQRVAFARALVFKPRALLMDEPLGALDKKLREWLQAEIKRVHLEVGSTFVYVTHDQDEALSLSDRIAVFNNGRIEQIGTPRELYERPQSMFVGQFLGESTVFRGQHEMTAADVTFSIGGCQVGGPRPDHPLHGALALLVRPENLRLHRAGRAPVGNGNVVRARVVSSSYLGSELRYVIELPDGTEGSVRTSSADELFSSGEAVDVNWDVRDGVVLSDGASASIT